MNLQLNGCLFSLSEKSKKLNVIMTILILDQTPLSVIPKVTFDCS